MTSLLRRKLRTTVPRTPAATGFNLVLLLALAAGPVLAQQPGRPVPPRSTPSPGSGGTVMYFHKPADALAPQSGTNASTAQLSDSGRSGATTSNNPAAVSDASSVAVPQEPWKSAGSQRVLERPLPTQPERVVVRTGQPTPSQPARVPVASSASVQLEPTTTTSFKQPPIIKTTPEDFAKWTRLPPRDMIFGMPDDAELERIIRQAIVKNRPKTVAEDVRFPVNPEVDAGVAYQPKTATYPPMRVNHEPLYVVHRRLGFEEKNAERYGWDLGFIQPIVSTLYFYKDVLLWPNSLASSCAYGGYDTNVGKCLPGSPTPYMLYPPGLTITGTVAEGAIITGAAFIFP